MADICQEIDCKAEGYWCDYHHPAIEERDAALAALRALVECYAGSGDLGRVLRVSQTRLSLRLRAAEALLEKHGR